ncbi:NADase-type glycan-binding domain-containing protein [Streptomyces sp. SLBN-118]|uniref:NADase-type glycan-binding domain-containing protein n=1 Tax=Streptomyces sp. SLBN-118 TaxID=2768454 RepID=UPI001152BF4F|nr:discoidin domain-containing protein [Streptomyces sp. SLBN-118]
MRWLVPLAVLLTLACVVYLTRVQIQAGVEAVKDKLAKPRQIHPLADRQRASSAAPGRSATLAFDGTTNEYWAPNLRGKAEGEFLEVDFARPFRLVEIHIFPGASTNEQVFLSQRRPAELKIAAVSAKGTKTKTAQLADLPGEQVVRMPVSDVKHVRLTVTNSLGPKDRRVAIAEVAFFMRP